MRKFLLLAVLLIGGCATATPITHKTPLTESEGVLISHVSCGKRVSGAVIYKSGIRSKVGIMGLSGIGSSDMLFCADEISIISLEEGEYYFGSITGMAETPAYVDESESLKFSVKRGSINYIGDLSIGSDAVTESIWRVGNVKVTINVQDKSNEMIQKLKNQYPELYKKYAYRDAIANW